MTAYYVLSLSLTFTSTVSSSGLVVTLGVSVTLRDAPLRGPLADTSGCGLAPPTVASRMGLT